MQQLPPNASCVPTTLSQDLARIPRSTPKCQSANVSVIRITGFRRAAPTANIRVWNALQIWTQILYSFRPSVIVRRDGSLWERSAKRVRLANTKVTSPQTAVRLALLEHTPTTQVPQSAQAVHSARSTTTTHSRVISAQGASIVRVLRWPSVQCVHLAHFPMSMVL